MTTAPSPFLITACPAEKPWDAKGLGGLLVRKFCLIEQGLSVRVPVPTWLARTIVCGQWPCLVDWAELLVRAPCIQVCTLSAVALRLTQ